MGAQRLTLPTLPRNFDALRDAPIAQLVERLTLNQRVRGSSPCGRTNIYIFTFKACPPRSRQVTFPPTFCLCVSARAIVDKRVTVWTFPPPGYVKRKSS